MNYIRGLKAIGAGFRNPEFYAGVLFIAANEFMQKSAKHTQKFKNETRGIAAETLFTGNLVMTATFFMKEKSPALKFTTLAGLVLYVIGGGINISSAKEDKERLGAVRPFQVISASAWTAANIAKLSFMGLGNPLLSRAAAILYPATSLMTLSDGIYEKDKNMTIAGVLSLCGAIAMILIPRFKK